VTALVFMGMSDFEANTAAIYMHAEQARCRTARDERPKLIVRESVTGEKLALIFETDWGAAIYFRDGRCDLDRTTDSYMPRRRGGWTVEPLTGDRRQFFEVFSNAAVYGLSAGALIARIAASHRVIEVTRSGRGGFERDGNRLRPIVDSGVPT
jgi:hypothetical protein